MLEIFTYSFMVGPFAAGIAIGGHCPAHRHLLVARRYSLIADSLAHVSLAGVGLALARRLSVPSSAPWQWPLPLLSQSSAFAPRGRLSGEVALAMFLSSGLAVAVVLIGVAKKVNVDLLSYLFGSSQPSARSTFGSSCL